jgi:hypothetical protein
MFLLTMQTGCFTHHAYHTGEMTLCDVFRLSTDFSRYRRVVGGVAEKISEIRATQIG